MRMLMVSPVPRGAIVLGKTLGATLMGAAFAVVLTPLAWVFDIHFTFDDWLKFLGATLLCSLALASLGMLVASRIRKLENFAVAMNFVIFPMFFLSGALYPTEKLAAWLQPLVRAEPAHLRRRPDAPLPARRGIPGGQPRSNSTPLFDIAYLVVFAVVSLAIATKLFGREEHLSAMFLGGEARKKLTPKKVGAGRLRLPAPSGPLCGIVGREFKRAVRQRGRLASTFARPLLWLIAAGTGFAALIPGGDYETYLLPGIIGMVILFSCLLSALGCVHDRQFGPMRMLLVAPISRGLVVLGKTLSSALLGTAFAVLFSVLVVFFDIEVSFDDYLGFLGAALLCALALSCARDARGLADPQARGLRGGDELRHLPALLLQRRALPGRATARLDAAAGAPQPAHLRGRPDAPDAAPQRAPSARPGPVRGLARRRLPRRLRARLLRARPLPLRPRRAPRADDARRRRPNGCRCCAAVPGGLTASRRPLGT